MKYAKRAAPVLALAAVLILWELAVDLFKIPLYVLPSPRKGGSGAGSGSLGPF